MTYSIGVTGSNRGKDLEEDRCGCCDTVSRRLALPYSKEINNYTCTTVYSVSVRVDV